MSERFFPDGMPAPMSDVITLPWWEAAAEHRLVVQRCTAAWSYIGTTGGTLLRGNEANRPSHDWYFTL